jgi:hypothetical protein
LERTKMGAVIAGACVVGGDRKGGPARPSSPADGDREQHRRIETAPGEHRDTLHPRERMLDRGLDRARKVGWQLVR